MFSRLFTNYDAKRKAFEEANKNSCWLRRPLYFPTRLADVGDINSPSTNHVGGWDTGYLEPILHWTLLCDIVGYMHNNFVGRPEIHCKDSDGVEFKVMGYFEDFGRRNPVFDRVIAAQIKPGRTTLAMRYCEKKTFMDLTTGVRLEDEHVNFVMVLPGTVEQVMSAADKYFQCDNYDAHRGVCWGCQKEGVASETVHAASAQAGKNKGKATASKREAAAPTSQCGDAETEMTELKTCGQCRTAKYCSKECQTADWKQGHKQDCKLLPGILLLIGRGPGRGNTFDITRWEGRHIPFRHGPMPAFM